MSHRPAVHLAVPVDDLVAARSFYGQVLGLPEGRSTDHWVDWNLEGHQVVTHLVPTAPQPSGTSLVGQHRVPIPHYGLLLDEQRFHRFAERLRAAGVRFDIEPHRRFPGEPGEQWTMFFRDPAGNALEFKSFRDESMVFAR
ncbi:VOC family protein [Streptomyces caelestis]|uniref:VOC family protein n=1 Tax=Streptomyces caelestis TaxID=36816 RepID=UPI00364F6C55